MSITSNKSEDRYLEDNDFEEYDGQSENEADIDPLNHTKISQAVVSGNDWTAETIINQIDKGNIQLNPSFQRRDAWTKSRKSKFIESLILGLPVPQLVLAESKERRGSYIVLDGKQRLLSIRQFAANPDDRDYDTLKLSGLEIRQDLKGKSLADLKNELDLFDDLSSFENQPIRTVVIKNWPNEAFLYHVFLRLNTGSVSLSHQELRQALHPGKFIDFLDENSGKSPALREILKKDKPDFRMRDSELLLRYFSFRNFFEDYSGVLKSFLDKTCEELNSHWSEFQEEAEQQLEEFEKAHDAVREIFGLDNMYRKWVKGRYESRFNRSIFDIMVLSLSDRLVREKVLAEKNNVENAFKELCETDRDFLSSIESTTKSITATSTRIAKWNSILNNILDLNLDVPMIQDGRICYR